MPWTLRVFVLSHAIVCGGGIQRTVIRGRGWTRKRSAPGSYAAVFVLPPWWVARRGFFGSSKLGESLAGIFLSI